VSIGVSVRARSRIKELQDEHKSLREALERHFTVRHASTYAKQRQELLAGGNGVRCRGGGRALASGLTCDKHDVWGDDLQARATAAESLARDSQSLARSNAMVGDYIEMAKTTMVSLRDQGLSLKVGCRLPP
jgi:hypothetical protein